MIQSCKAISDLLLRVENQGESIVMILLLAKSLKPSMNLAYGQVRGLLKTEVIPWLLHVRFRSGSPIGTEKSLVTAK